MKSIEKPKTSEPKESPEAPKGVRDFPLTGKAEKKFREIVEYCTKNNEGSEQSLKEAYFEAFEAETPFGEAMRKRGYGDETAQRWVLDFVKTNIGRKVTKRVYGVVFRPVSIRNEVSVDSEGKKTPGIHMFGNCKLIDLKKNQLIDLDKLAEVHAYASDTSKVEDVGMNEVYLIQAATSVVTATVLNLTVDDRCQDAKKSDIKLQDFDKVLTKFYEVTPLKKVYENPSKDRTDLRLVEGRITFINFPRNKNYALVELTDDSVSLDYIEKKKNKANLRVMCSKEAISHFGKDSIVRMLGNVKKENSEQYGESVSMLFPAMIYGIVVIAPETGSSKSDDEEEQDASKYFSKKKETPAVPEEDKKKYDDVAKDEKKEEEEDDEEEDDEEDDDEDDDEEEEEEEEEDE
jgi:hypothetical protein